MDLKTTYNKIAKEWVRDHSNDDWWKDGTDYLLKMLQPQATILDVGCGGGTKSRYLAKKGFKVLGIDFSEEMIEIAKKDVPEAHFEVRDLFDLENFHQSFDCIFAQAVLLHIPKKDILHILKNFYAKMNRDGYMYIAVKKVGSDGIEEKMITEKDYGYSYERFFSFYTEEEIEKLLKEVGLKVIWKNEADSGKTNWIQIITQKI